MTQPKEAREPTPPSFQRGIGPVTDGKFGSRHTWDFDVPAWSQFLNPAEKISPQAVEVPLTSVNEEGWARVLMIGLNETT